MYTCFGTDKNLKTNIFLKIIIYLLDLKQEADTKGKILHPVSSEISLVNLKLYVVGSILVS